MAKSSDYSGMSASERVRFTNELKERKENLADDLARVIAQIDAHGRGVPYNDDDLQIAIYKALAKHPKGLLGCVGIYQKIKDYPEMSHLSYLHVKEWVKTHPGSLRMVGRKYFLP